MRSRVNNKESPDPPSSDIHKFTNTLDTRGLVEVTCTNRLAHYIKIRASRDKFHLLHLHDILELHPNFARLPQELGMEEMLHAPIIAEPISTGGSVRRLRAGKERTHDPSIVEIH